MVQVKQYHLPPTPLILNSPKPLLYYPGILLSGLSASRESEAKAESELSSNTQTNTHDNDNTNNNNIIHANTTTINPLTAHAYDTFTHNNWQVQWIYRYGPTQPSHYHSSVHECMAVLSGTATIRFGVADANTNTTTNTTTTTTTDGLETKTTDGSSSSASGDRAEGKGKGGDRAEGQGEGQGQGKGEGEGVTIHASAGDVFILPAGVAHKTYDTRPGAEFALLTPGDGHSVAVAAGDRDGQDQDADADAEADAVRRAVTEVRLDGFCMLGAYPFPEDEDGDGDDNGDGSRNGNGTQKSNGNVWDFRVGGEDVGQYERVWAVKKPKRDPVLGDSPEGICGLWQ